MPVTKTKPTPAITKDRPKPPCRLKPRKPDPLTKNMLKVLKAIQGGKRIASSGAKTPEEGAKQGGLAYTLKHLARRKLIALDANGVPKLLAAGKLAIVAVYGG